MREVPGVTQSPGRAGTNPPSADLPVVMDPLEHRAYCFQALQIECRLLLCVLKSFSDISELPLRKLLIKG